MLVFFSYVLCSVISFSVGAVTVAYGHVLIKREKAKKIDNIIKIERV